TLSLREAIALTNLNLGFHTIRFELGAGVQHLRPSRALPALTQSVTIDATAPTDFPTEQIVLDGNQAGTGSNGLVIGGGNSTINGAFHLAVVGFSGAGILFQGPGFNFVEGVFLGLDFTQTLGHGNGIGLSITGSANNTIGGGAFNFISGNRG